MKIIFLSLLIGAFTFNLSAQNKKFSTYFSIGGSSSILDNGYGFHSGLNPYFAFNNRFGIEGQVSYGYTKITGSFLSGKKGNVNNLNTLIGGRFYLLKKSKPTSLYVNFLFGADFVRSALEDYIENLIEPGVSTGIFIEKNKYVFGFSIDSPQNLIVKIGYIF